jgi:putative transposase
MNKRSVDDWTALIELQKTSGLSVIDFCKQQHISNKTFYARRKQLHPQLRTTLLTKKPTGFVKLAKQHNGSEILILRTGDVTLSLPLHCEPMWLAKLLKGLSA